MVAGHGEQWPAETAYPTVELADGRAIEFDGVTIAVRELGPAESHADSYLTATPDDGPPLAFIGDVAFHGMHSYTADGHTGAWLSTLDILAAELGGFARLYPGHGAPVGPEIFANQRRYLLYYREVVRRLAGGQPRLTEAALTELEGEVGRFLPRAPLSWMIKLGADPVAAELIGQPPLWTPRP